MAKLSGSKDGTRGQDFLALPFRIECPVRWQGGQDFLFRGPGFNIRRNVSQLKREEQNLESDS